ncbi:pyridoxal phosphate-dependent decarboxylase family protein [Kocuria palustris]|uniref:pyridoxal phosphate-dependent decarboxylase family protein n=1 Tax=Kocuria palustris TaxID=71999 RepID=UPI00230077DC|nr:aspartate aminotransferase family protein [Kocuria palustris]
MPPAPDPADSTICRPPAVPASAQRDLLAAATAPQLREAVASAARTSSARLAEAGAAHSPAGFDDLAALIDPIDLDRPLGDLDSALGELDELWLRHAVWFHLPRTAAHLNCPVAVPAVAAETMAAIVNTSVDTWDQSTSATLIERRLLAWTAQRIGFSDGADGMFTPGGTTSTLQALMLARDEALERSAATPRAEPRPVRAARLRLLASEQSHFSVLTAAHILGLDDDAVVQVPVDDDGRMLPEALELALEDLRAQGLVPAAVVATAGTMDRGAIDPLERIAQLCAEAGTWLHVDAAYGGGLLASPTQRERLAGIEQADSVTIDFHKSWFQPVSCSAVIVRDPRTLRHCTHHADYLNPADTPEPNQVDRSLQTTRRFDALKLWTTLRAMGPERIGELFDRCCALAQETAREITADPRFELIAQPSLSTVLFRWLPLDGSDPQALVRPVRRRVWDDASSTVAETVVDGQRCLKLTLLNPAAQLSDLHAVLDDVHRAGEAVLAERAAQPHPDMAQTAERIR